MKNELPDIHVDDLVEFMSYLEPHPPITVEYSKSRKLSREAKMLRRDGKSQKSHMIGWYADQPTTGSGKYTRSKGNESSRVAYNRFLNQYGLLWMAEVFGESEEALRQAMKAAKEAEEIDYRGRCNAFRKVISFDRIIELFLYPQGWRYDSQILPLLEFDDETGAPFVTDEHEQEYMTVLEKEKCI